MRCKITLWLWWCTKNRVRQTRIFPGCLLLLSLNACTSAYVPSVINTPLHTEKHEFQLSGYAGTNALDAQASLSLTDHLAVMGNYSVNPSEQYHYMGEGGIGYYGTGNAVSLFEVYGGYGYGDVYGNAVTGFYGSSPLIGGQYSKYFLQAGVGSGGGEIYQAGLTVRGSYIDFRNMNIRGSEYKGSRDNGFFIEPAMTARVGHKYIFFTTQVGASISTTGEVFHHAPFMLSLGMHIKVDEIFEE